MTEAKLTNHKTELLTYLRVIVRLKGLYYFRTANTLILLGITNIHSLRSLSI
jgi:hypothetical protein